MGDGVQTQDRGERFVDIALKLLKAVAVIGIGFSLRGDVTRRNAEQYRFQYGT